MKPRTLALLLLAVLVYLGWRALVLFGAFDHVAMWMYEQYPMGTIPKVLPEGHSLPLGDYYDNAAGQLLTGLFAIPFYQLCGPSYLSLKLVPLTLGLLALVALFLGVRRFFGDAPALLVACLFALAPTSLVKYSLMASGNHFENVFFSSFALVCALGLHVSQRERAKAWLLLSGFTAGFAVFVFLGAIIPVGLIALVHLGRRGWRQTLRDFPSVGPAFVLGILPLLWLNFGPDSRGVEFLDQRMGAERGSGAGGIAGRFVDFFAEHLPRAGVFEAFLGVPAAAWGWLFLAATAAAWLAALPGAWRGLYSLVPRWFGRTARECTLAELALVPLVLYLPLTALAYGASDLRIGGFPWPIEAAGYRYFLLHLSFALVLIALAVARGWLAGGWQRITAVLLALCAFAPALSTAAIVDFEFKGADVGRRYPGAPYVLLARGLLGKKNAHTPAEVVELVARMPPRQRSEVWLGVGFFSAWDAYETQLQAGGHFDFEAFDLERLCNAWPSQARPDVARGAGVFLRRTFLRNGDLKSAPALERALLGLLERSTPFAEQAIAGLAHPWDFPLAHKTRTTLEENQRLLTFADARLRSALAQGYGFFAGKLFARGIQSDLEALTRALRELPADSQVDFAVGLGAGLVAGNESPSFDAAPAALPTAMRDAARQAFEAELARYEAH